MIGALTGATAWSEEQKIIASDPVALDEFARELDGQGVPGELKVRMPESGVLRIGSKGEVDVRSAEPAEALDRIESDAPELVLLDEPMGRALGAPIFRAATLGARSEAQGIRLKMSVQTLSTVKSVVPESLIVPPSFMNGL